MIAITANSISLVMPIQDLQQLLYLQLAVISAIRKEVSVGQIDGPTVVGPLVELLDATMFSPAQVDEIEAMFKKKAAKPTTRAAA